MIFPGLVVLEGVRAKDLASRRRGRHAVKPTGTERSAGYGEARQFAELFAIDLPSLD
jgi:hypothetical protein